MRIVPVCAVTALVCGLAVGAVEGVSEGALAFFLVFFFLFCAGLSVVAMETWIRRHPK